MSNNEVRIVVTGDNRSSKAALAEADAQWKAWARSVEQSGDKVSASLKRTREQADRDITATMRSIIGLSGAADEYGDGVLRASGDSTRATGLIRAAAESDLGAVGVSFGQAGEDAYGFARSTDDASTKAGGSIRRMRDEIDDALSGIGDINIGVSGGFSTAGLFDGVEEEAEKAGEEAGEAFVRGADGRLRSSLTGRFAAAGKDAGKGAGDGILSGLSPIPGKAHAIAGAAAVALAALGPVSQLTGGAIALGLGGGLAAVGVMSATQSEKVKEEWSGLGDWFKTELDDIDGPIEQALLRIPDTARQSFLGVKGELEDSFSQVGPALEGFASDWGATLSGADLSAETNGFVQVLDAIGYKSEEIGAEFGVAFDEMSRVAAEHADDIAAMVEIVADGFTKVAQFAGFVADTWDDELGNAETKLKAFGGVLTGKLIGDLDNSGAAAGRAARFAVEMATGWNDAATEADDLSRQVQALNEMLEKNYDPAKAALDAAIDWKEALADLKKENEDGNMSLLDREKALSNLLDPLRNSIDAELELTQGVQDSTAAFQDQLPQLVELARNSEEGQRTLTELAEVLGVGLVEAGENAYVTIDKAGEAIKILPDGKVVKLDAVIDSLEAQLRRAREQLDSPNISRERKAKLNADIKQLEDALRRARQQLDALDGKTVQTWVVTNTVRGGGHPLMASGGIVGGIGAFADGGAVGPRGGMFAESGSALALVGEAGREIVRLPYGSQVIPNGQTERMLAEGDGILRGYASGGPLGVSVHIPPPSTRTEAYGGSMGLPPARSGSGSGRVEVVLGDVSGSTSYETFPNPYGGGWGGWPGGGGGSGGGGGAPVPGVPEDTTSTYTPITRPTGGKVPAVIDSNPVPANRRGDDFGAGFFAGQGGVPLAGFSGGGSGGGGGGGGAGTTVINVSVIVQGSIRAERDIEEIVANAISRGGFRGVLP
ncbi:hypothetical protein [Acrocarpospora sp. B8E8]|uniref:hypothetical protein n=1 Tax=Acrocarpospora sp. B8E8 TaxID=3153572 RepID=UPI00325C39DB